MPRHEFARLAATFSAGVALYDRDGTLEFSNRSFRSGSLDPPDVLSDHIKCHAIAFDEDCNPVTEDTCPACVAAKNRNASSGLIGVPTPTGGINWRFILAEYRQGGGLAVTTANAGHTPRREPACNAALLR